MEIIVVILAYLFGGIVDAVCGGGGLIILPAFFAIGVPPHVAVGTNQTAVLPGIVTSVAKLFSKILLMQRLITAILKKLKTLLHAKEFI